jgi:hypothetical protein
MSALLKFGKANSKLRELEKSAHVRIATLALLPGKHGRITTCPGAVDCKAWIVEKPAGGRKLVDGPDALYRCYFASIAAQYPQTYAQAKHNLLLLRRAKSADNIADLISRSWPAWADVARWHTGADFYNRDYLAGFYMALGAIDGGRRAYFYSKSAHLLADTIDLKPASVSVTASIGGRYDAIALAGNMRAVRVFGIDVPAGMEIDHDDSHALAPNTGPNGGAKSLAGVDFGLQVHGTQRRGSWGGAELVQLKKSGVKSGYTRKGSSK